MSETDRFRLESVVTKVPTPRTSTPFRTPARKTDVYISVDQARARILLRAQKLNHATGSYVHSLPSHAACRMRCDSHSSSQVVPTGNTRLLTVRPCPARNRSMPQKSQIKATLGENVGTYQ